MTENSQKAYSLGEQKAKVKNFPSSPACIINRDRAQYGNKVISHFKSPNLTDGRLLLDIRHFLRFFFSFEMDCPASPFKSELVIQSEDQYV